MQVILFILFFLKLRFGLVFDNLDNQTKKLYLNYLFIVQITQFTMQKIAWSIRSNERENTDTRNKERKRTYMRKAYVTDEHVGFDLYLR